MPLRLGLIIPSSNRMVEEEMVRHLPPAVVAHVARLRMTGAHHVPIDRLIPRAEEAAATLADARCEVIAEHDMLSRIDREPPIFAACWLGSEGRLSVYSTPKGR